MKKYLSLLKKLGLSEKESFIYLDLLEHGESSITNIVSRTGLHRPEVYRFLPLLQDAGFVNVVIKAKRRFFVPESPHHLHQLLQNLEKDMNTLLPDLISMHI